ncbi:MAG: radical SAM family heme chaperone HemW [Bacteroidia bacterium]|nr:radical SAM family heme chaperone HemW [Bacteroidia bacterium]
MAGIYIHIPFCKQACHYCNFHFTTSLNRKNELIDALLKEAGHQKDYLSGEPVETIYFGGGTPSLCTIDELKLLLDKIHSAFIIAPGTEITLEANPDDITSENQQHGKCGFTRLSIGIQSFFDEDLRWMNRAHSAEEATNSLELSLNYFDNITIDLIYGYPLLTDEKWKQNIDTAISFKIPHISCYALTAEPKTFLQRQISLKREKEMDAEKQAGQFLFLIDRLDTSGFEHYEISNFALPGFRSRHNSSYWEGKKYLGLGPSAHSYDGQSRQWNVSNNHLYIDSLNKGLPAYEKEQLTAVQKVNEYIMTSLRTAEGIGLGKLDAGMKAHLRSKIRKYVEKGWAMETEAFIKLTNEGKLMADGIASDLFF